MNLYESVVENLDNTYIHFDERTYKVGDIIKPKYYNYLKAKNICNAYTEETGLDITKLVYLYKELDEYNEDNGPFLYKVEDKKCFKGYTSYSPYMCFDCILSYLNGPLDVDVMPLIPDIIENFVKAYNPNDKDTAKAKEKLEKEYHYPGSNRFEYITDQEVKVIEILRGGK